MAAKVLLGLRDLFENDQCTCNCIVENVFNVLVKGPYLLLVYGSSD